MNFCIHGLTQPVEERVGFVDVMVWNNCNAGRLRRKTMCVVSNWELGKEMYEMGSACSPSSLLTVSLFFHLESRQRGILTKVAVHCGL